MLDKNEILRLRSNGYTHAEIASQVGCSEGRVWQILREFGKTKSVMSMTIEERLQSRLQTNEETGCWEFQGNKYEFGYGQITLDGKSVRAHRLAYSLFVGEIPEGMIVCHTCDNPPCCNPDHLFLGTHADNSKDKTNKGRQAKGTKLPFTKLPDDCIEQASLLRDEGLSVQEIADMFGCSKGHVYRLLKGSRG